MGFREKIRALLEADDGDDEDTGSATDAIEADLADALADEGDGDDADGIGESGADEESGDEIESGDEGADEIEGTPGDEAEESPEEADLRAKIIEQAEQIEALRNRLAAAGIEDDIEDVAEVAEDEVEDTDGEDVVAAFDSDYAEREARLAEIKEN
jgi:hypothetical protein